MTPGILGPRESNQPVVSDITSIYVHVPTHTDTHIDTYTYFKTIFARKKGNVIKSFKNTNEHKKKPISESLYIFTET